MVVTPYAEGIQGVPGDHWIMYPYINIGSSSIPVFNTTTGLLSSSNHALQRTKEFYDSSGVKYPTWADVDKDGLPDFVIATSMHADGPGDANKALLYFYRNTGTKEAPEFLGAANAASEPGFNLLGSTCAGCSGTCSEGDVSTSFVDFDRDGNVDFFVAGGCRSSIKPFKRNVGTAGATLTLQNPIGKDASVFPAHLFNGANGGWHFAAAFVSNPACGESDIREGIVVPTHLCKQWRGGRACVPIIF